MISIIKNFIFVTFMALLLLVTNNAVAKVSGVPAATQARYQSCSGGDGSSTTEASDGSADVCWLSSGNSPGLFRSDLTFQVSKFVDLNEEFQTAYFPSNGKFKIREYICRSSSVSWCTIKNATTHVDGASSFTGNTQATIQAQNPQFGGNAIQLATGYTFTICLAFIDEQGVAWGNKDAIACKDAAQLPETPSLCRLNGSQDLNVDMGTIDVKGIATTPQVGASSNVKKSIIFSCSGNSEINVKTQFAFQQRVLNGASTISTSIDNLGVALIYKGKVVTPQDSIQESFSAGNNNLTLEFAAIRNATKNSVAPGQFNADAVMTVTIQ